MEDVVAMALLLPDPSSFAPKKEFFTLSYMVQGRLSSFSTNPLIMLFFCFKLHYNGFKDSDKGRMKYSYDF